MGRLDDAAKHKVVELRRTGLSLRKIKAVLELENIKVSAQAIFVFLREFQGRRPGRVKPVQAGGSTGPQHTHTRTGGVQENLRSIQLQSLLNHAGDLPKQTPAEPDPNAKPSGSGETSRGSRLGQKPRACEEERDIQIVSVTSLAQNRQGAASQSVVTRAGTGSVSSTGPAAAAALTRRRVTPSPATNSILAARKRLDKALSHRMKMPSMLRRDHSSVQGSGLRTALPQPPETYDLTREKTAMDGQPGAGNAARRFLTQRPGLSVRSLQAPPRIGIRLPNRAAPLTSSAPGGTAIHRQAPAGSQGAARTEGNPGPQQPVQDLGGRGGLQEQIQTLGSEVHSLGLAVKMLLEQQRRLEREQSQQTHIQKQILSTLQNLTSKLGSCSSSQQHHNRTQSPTTTSFSQDSFNFSHATYSQCNQSQASYDPLENLEPVEAFKVPSADMNGFPACSSTDGLRLSHTPPQTQAYAAAYSQQSSQTLMPSYTQPYVLSYSQSHSQTYGGSESKASGFPGSSCSGRTLPDCLASPQTPLIPSRPPQDQQISIIKEEGP